MPNDPVLHFGSGTGIWKGSEVLSEGINMSGQRIHNMSYADGIVLMADSVEKILDLLIRLERTWTRYKLNINVNKTKEGRNLVCDWKLDRSSSWIPSRAWKWTSGRKDLLEDGERMTMFVYEHRRTRRTAILY